MLEVKATLQCERRFLYPHHVFAASHVRSIPLWSRQERLIEELLATPRDRFERLARRLLREAGFISATVTGKSGDGGIDGIGVYRLSLASFPVFFQCKR